MSNSCRVHFAPFIICSNFCLSTVAAPSGLRRRTDPASC
jgi:hypothetical protein